MEPFNGQQNRFLLLNRYVANVQYYLLTANKYPSSGQYHSSIPKDLYCGANIWQHVVKNNFQNRIKVTLQVTIHLYITI